MTAEEPTSSTTSTTSTNKVRLTPIPIGRVHCLRCKKNVRTLAGAQEHEKETNGKHRWFKGSDGRKRGR